MMTRFDLPEMFNKRGLVGYGAEIGVRDGYFSRHILENWAGRKLYLVDSWQHMEEYTDVSNADSPEQIRRLKATIDAVAPYWDRVRIVQERSVQAARLVPNRSLDFIFLDANHAYEHVLADLVTWRHKVREGGIISGHDFLNGGHEIDGVYTEFGVKKAVERFFAGRQINVTDEIVAPGNDYPSWWVQL